MEKPSQHLNIFQVVNCRTGLQSGSVCCVHGTRGKSQSRVCNRQHINMYVFVASTLYMQLAFILAHADCTKKKTEFDRVKPETVSNSPDYLDCMQDTSIRIDKIQKSNSFNSFNSFHDLFSRRLTYGGYLYIYLYIYHIVVLDNYDWNWNCNSLVFFLLVVVIAFVFLR